MAKSSGFVLSDTAMYAYSCQDVYDDIVSFSAAIPLHLRPLFLIPVEVDFAEPNVKNASTASDIIPSGYTDVAEMAQNRTFVNYDYENSTPNDSPGSIYDFSDPSTRTHYQEWNYDENWSPVFDTMYNKDDGSGYTKYPYRLNERVTNSSLAPLITKLALKPEDLEGKTPSKTRDRSDACSVSMNSYNKRTKVFQFRVNCGNGPHEVSAALNSIDNISLVCDCKFWQYNGPEYHAKSKSYLLGQPNGKASPPNVRDPERKHFLCKHAYAVISKMESFVSDVVDNNWDMTEDEILEYVDNRWSDLK